MYDFVAHIILMASLGAMIYVVARAAPRVGDSLAVEGVSHKENSARLEKLDGILHAFLEKTLRRIKLILMQLDNVVSGYLHHVKRFQRAQEEKPNLFESLEANDSGEQNPDQKKLFKE